MADKKDEEPQTAIGAVMDAAWNEVMTEAANELPDQYEHLGEPNTKVPESIDESDKGNIQDSLSIDKDLEAEKPIEDAAAKVEEDTQKVETVDAPQHWPEKDRATFSKLPEEGQKFLLRRHKEMEADYTRKTQEHAGVVKLGKPFQEYLSQGMGAHLARNNVSNEDFIGQLVAFHRLSIENPVEFVKQTAKNLGIDTAKVFGQQSTDESKDPKDPKLSPVVERVVALEQRLASDEATRQQQLTQKVANDLKAFSEEKDTEGNPLRPHFEKVRETMGRLMLADPSLDLAESYNVACYRDPELRTTIVTPKPNTPAETTTNPLNARKVKEAEQALAAKRSNIRSGNGAGTEKAKAGGKELPTLREAMAAAADEVGFDRN